MNKIFLFFSALFTVVFLAACNVQPLANQNINQPLAEKDANDLKYCESDNDCEVIYGVKYNEECTADCFNSAVKNDPECSSVAWTVIVNDCACINHQCEARSSDQSVADILKQLFAAKYQKAESEISVIISQQAEKFVKGGVTIGQPGPGAGGYFLAAQVNGKWQLVFDGNGSIDCALVRPYGFPADMISDCAEAPASGQVYVNTQPAFQFTYPKDWQSSVSSSGVKKTVTLKDFRQGYEGSSYVVATLSYAPNQGGVSLAEWTAEITRAGNWKVSAAQIAGLEANKLTMSESEAGPRYLFISADKKTMYDWQFVGVSSAVIDKTISSFILN